MKNDRFTGTELSTNLILTKSGIFQNELVDTYITCDAHLISYIKNPHKLLHEPFIIMEFEIIDLKYRFLKHILSIGEGFSAEEAAQKAGIRFLRLNQKLDYSVDGITFIKDSTESRINSPRISLQFSRAEDGTILTTLT